VTLPDSRRYPPGTEIVIWNNSSYTLTPTYTLTVSATGVGGASTNIYGPVSGANQLVLPGETKRFITPGGSAGWYVSREGFSTGVEIPMSSGLSSVDVSGNSQWRYDSAFEWSTLTANACDVTFPLQLPIGANVTHLDAVLQTTGSLPVVGNRLVAALIKNTIAWSTGAKTGSSLGSVTQNALGVAVLSTPAINQRVEADSSYMVRVGHTGLTAGSTFLVGGLRIRYTL
jgi:hypothetical protein